MRNAHNTLSETDTIKRHSPVDQHVLSQIEISSEQQIVQTAQSARAAQQQWSRIPFRKRVKMLKESSKEMLKWRNEILDILRDESGKYPIEGLFSEAIAPLDQLLHWIKIVRPYIKRKRLPISSLSFPRKKGYIEIMPRGVVGVIAPWNYPLANLFRPVFPALLCGNSVVIKPSEQAPRAAAWFVEQISKHLPDGIVQCVFGDGIAGELLIKSGIDSLVFTGSTRTGREVISLAAERMIPCSAEMGGKDPAIVFSDCNLERTVAGIVYWALHNVGQNCGAIERVYVMEDIADRFVELLAHGVSRLRTSPPEDPDIDIGPLNNLKQLAIVEHHVEDALEKGASLLCGGTRSGSGLWYEPTVLDHCNHRMKIMTEETFGPVIPVVRVQTVDEAIDLANSSLFGLTASLWTANSRRAETVAKRLEAGTVTINNHAITGAMPFAPWTGVKGSGYGITNSVYSLSAFTRPKTYLLDNNKMPDPWWFPFSHNLIETGHLLAEIQLGTFKRALKLPLVLSKRKKFISEFYGSKK